MHAPFQLSRRNVLCRVHAGVLLMLAGTMTLSCAGIVKSEYVRAGYDARLPGAIKRIVVTASVEVAGVPGTAIDSTRQANATSTTNSTATGTADVAPASTADTVAAPAPASSSSLAIASSSELGDSIAQLAAQITTDLVRLRKNYLVYNPRASGGPSAETCNGLDGVLSLHTHDLTRNDDGNVSLRMTAELYRCSDGLLMWQTQGTVALASNEESLVGLTSIYRDQLGEVARNYAAPLFAIIQALMLSLPDPVLNDEEIMEKIELG